MWSAHQFRRSSLFPCSLFLSFPSVLSFFSCVCAVAHFPLPLHEMHRVVDDIFGVSSMEEVFARLTPYFDEEVEAEAPAAAAGDKKAADAAAPKKKNTTKKKKHSAAVQAFVTEILNRLLAASPTSLKVTFKQLQLAQFLPLERCIQLEYRLAQRLLCSKENPLKESDLFRAPDWTAKNFKQIPDAEVERIFAEDWDKDNELELTYPEKNKPVWYI